MSRETLLEKVRADGRARVEAVEAKLKQALADIDARRESEVARLEAEFSERTERETRLILERARSKARMERRKALLAARWDAVERVFELAREKAVAGAEYPRLMKGIVRRHGGEGVAVRLSARDREAIGRDIGASLGETAPIAGGVLIQAGRRVLDFSLDESLAAIRDELASELVDLLYPDSKEKPPA